MVDRRLSGWGETFPSAPQSGLGWNQRRSDGKLLEFGKCGGGGEQEAQSSNRRQVRGGLAEAQERMQDIATGCAWTMYHSSANAEQLSGSGESGKSTIVKQMKIIHQNGYTVDELALYRLTIYKNVVDCAKALIGAMRQFDINPKTTINEDYANYLLQYVVDPDPHKPLDPQVGQAVVSLWKDTSVDQVMEHQSEFYLMDSAP